MAIVPARFRTNPYQEKVIRMDRRDFLKSALAAGVGIGLAGTPFSSSPFRAAGAAFGAEAGGTPDIVAVRNGEPEIMFDRGIAAMGGMGRFVRPGQKVTIKPNVSWVGTVESAADTNPALLHRIIRHCLDAGAARVTVMDHTIEHWRDCYEQSGIGAATRDAGALVAPAESERYYHRTAIGGRILKEAMVHESILEADVLISVPVLKHHGGAGMTASLKNFMGAVWDRRFYHGRGLQQCIADFFSLRRPDLTVIDAYRALINNGPRSRSLSDVRLMKMQILSTDVVAADASAARLLGKEPTDFGHVKIAAEMGFGQIDPGRLVGRRISL